MSDEVKRVFGEYIPSSCHLTCLPGPKMAITPTITKLRTFKGGAPASPSEGVLGVVAPGAEYYAIGSKVLTRPTSGEALITDMGAQVQHLNLSVKIKSSLGQTPLLAVKDASDTITVLLGSLPQQGTTQHHRVVRISLSDIAKQIGIPSLPIRRVSLWAGTVGDTSMALLLAACPAGVLLVRFLASHFVYFSLNFIIVSSINRVSSPSLTFIGPNCPRRCPLYTLFLPSLPPSLT